MERSYPQGKTDLEFVGKFHTEFANLRYVIEFKYFSNGEMKKKKTTIEEFQLIPKETEQIEGYSKGLRQEYSEKNFPNILLKDKKMIE